MGGAATVVERLSRYREMGFDHVMVRHVVGDHQLMLRSFERIGRDVMPRIREPLARAEPARASAAWLPPPLEIEVHAPQLLDLGLETGGFLLAKLQL